MWVLKCEPFVEQSVAMVVDVGSNATLRLIKYFLKLIGKYICASMYLPIFFRNGMVVFGHRAVSFLFGHFFTLQNKSIDNSAEDTLSCCYVFLLFGDFTKSMKEVR